MELYVLTGFLGAGKTTILLKILEKLKGKRIGVIQNEFGKLGIDGEILKHNDVEMVEINRGSIFCSCLKLQFVQALSEMAQYEFDKLFVESSGLGDPSNVEEILKASEIVSGKQYDFKGVICFVDGVNFLKQLEDLETVYRQLKHCHLAVITKTDLVSEEEVNHLYRVIRKINPVCKIVESANGNLNLSVLDEDLLLYQWAESEETTNTEETKPKTLVMEIDSRVEEKGLLSFLQEISQSVYRVKGFVALKGKGWHQVDLVGEKVDLQKVDDLEKSQIVFISKIGPAVIKKIFDVWAKYTDTEMKLKN
ncbi:CobW family GTP-binding protein [Faecalimonas sp.]